MDVSDNVAEWRDIVSPLHKNMNRNSNKRKDSGSVNVPKEAKVLKEIDKEVDFTSSLLGRFSHC